MSYTALSTIHSPATGTVAPATWGSQIHTNLEFLVDPPTCSVFHSTTQSVANNTGTALSADSENYDNDAMHSTVTNNTRLTIQTAGRYLFLATTNFDPDVDGFRNTRFRIDGTTNFADTQITVGGALNSVGFSVVGTAALTVGQYVEAIAQHTAGANLNVQLREFTAVYLTR